MVLLPSRHLGEPLMLQKLCMVKSRSAGSTKQIVQCPDGSCRKSLKAAGGLTASLAFLTSFLSALLIQSNSTRLCKSFVLASVMAPLPALAFEISSPISKEGVL